MTEHRTFRSGRPDGRFLTTPGFVHHRLQALRPKLAFDPSFTREQFDEWKRRVRSRLRRLFALPRLGRLPAPAMVDSQTRDGYTLQRWEIYPEPDSVVPCLMLVPDGASRSSPVPAVLCLPGTDHPKECLAGEPCEWPWGSRFQEQDRMALHLVRAGLAAAVMDNPSTAELFDPLMTDWRRQSLELLWLGRSYEGLSTLHKLAALRWLRTVPLVDRGRIAVCGHSLGAKPALMAGLLDPTVRAVVWNDHAADWRVRSVTTNLMPVAPWHYVPGFALWFDYMDLMAALAPTPLLVTEGGRGEDHRRIRRAYALAGAAGGFRVTYMPSFASAQGRALDRRRMPVGLTAEEYARYCSFDGDHYFKADAAVPWLRRVLGPEGDVRRPQAAESFA